jgi:hypothetical protein
MHPCMYAPHYQLLSSNNAWCRSESPNCSYDRVAAFRAATKAFVRELPQYVRKYAYAVIPKPRTSSEFILLMLPIKHPDCPCILKIIWHVQVSLLSVMLRFSGLVVMISVSHWDFEDSLRLHRRSPVRPRAEPLFLFPLKLAFFLN